MAWHYQNTDYKICHHSCDNDATKRRQKTKNIINYIHSQRSTDHQPLIRMYSSAVPIESKRNHEAHVTAKEKYLMYWKQVGGPCPLTGDKRHVCGDKRHVKKNTWRTVRIIHYKLKQLTTRWRLRYTGSQKVVQWNISGQRTSFSRLHNKTDDRQKRFEVFLTTDLLKIGVNCVEVLQEGQKEATGWENEEIRSDYFPIKSSRRYAQMNVSIWAYR